MWLFKRRRQRQLNQGSKVTTQAQSTLSPWGATKGQGTKLLTQNVSEEDKKHKRGEKCGPKTASTFQKWSLAIKEAMEHHSETTRLSNGEPIVEESHQRRLHDYQM